MDTTWLDEFRRAYGWRPSGEKRKYVSTIKKISGPDDIARLNEMVDLRKSGYTLQKIAVKFGISRERVRQLIGNSGYMAFDLMHKEREAVVEKSKDLTTPELLKKLGISSGSLPKRNYHHPIENSDSSTYRGNVAEVRAAEIIRQHGLTAELMPLQHPFDILVNGSIRLDVKSAHKPLTSPSILRRSTSPMWKFKVGKNSRDKCDFYFCIITETEDVFIIPSKDVPASMQFLVFCYPTERPEIAKWQNYHDAYDLLEAQP